MRGPGLPGLPVSRGPVYAARAPLRIRPEGKPAHAAALWHRCLPARSAGFHQGQPADPSNLGGTQTDARIFEVTLRLQPNSHGSKLGVDIPVYALVRPQQGDAGHTFFAYWCPYAQNQTFSCMLGNGAKFMFTAIMDGCSFGVGTEASPGQVRVAHANRGAIGVEAEEHVGMAEARNRQAIAQSQSLSLTVGGDVRTIGPSDYRQDIDGSSVLSSTTFGWHDLGGPWVFFTQRYWKNADVIPARRYLRDVIQQL
jgi:hypothetical protein